MTATLPIIIRLQCLQLQQEEAAVIILQLKLLHLHPAATVLQSNRVYLPGILSLLTTNLKIFFCSFLRSKQKQNASRQNDSPRRSVAIENLQASQSNSQSKQSNSHENNSLTVNNNIDKKSTDTVDNIIVDASPPLVLTQSTIETLNSMTTENLGDNDEKNQSKGEL